ncbi:hypothetical protein [Nonomuraea sp. bgisy101]|uniref:hypothetical protein n=1 Tax=Nonomuraea sp. bgisy101 TaxID=3413784 RepID=UPI003D7223B8
MLSEFRSRMIAHELEEWPLDLVLAALQEHGLLAADGKQRTDLYRSRTHAQKLSSRFFG